MLKIRKIVSVYVSIVFMLTMLFSGVSFAQQTETEVKLSVTNYTQQPHEWLCWSASAAMIISYFNEDSIDRTVEIAQDYYESTLEEEFNQTLPLSLSRDKGEIVENYTDGVSSINRTASVFDHPNRDTIYNRISFKEIKTYIDNSYPILASIPGYISLPGGGHAVVITGYGESDSNKYVIYNDPWDGEEHTMDFDTFTTMSYNLFYTGSTPPEIPEEPNDSFETAKRIYASPTPELELSYLNAGEEHYYTFMTSAAATYVIETTGTTDTFGELYDDSDNPVHLRSDSNSGEDDNFKIVKQSGGRQRYYIKVSHNDIDAEGSYGIKITMKANAPDNFKAQENEGNIKLTWDSVSWANEYKISVNGGEFFSVGDNTSYTHEAQGKQSYKVKADNSVETQTLTVNGIMSDGEMNLITYGDVNGDGLVTKSDIELIAEYIVGQVDFTDNQKTAANVNDDDTISTFDLITLSRYVSGEISELPVAHIE
ncbi:C39 family peptidase [Herbivorax sp. ANBcel31]|uniref:C39 family peptidase n=1 Tax=Herbivorax sp. ANBcel31 TaxID=3069754 RepID=UPI0027B3FEA1|nr:C39 family peptidase [Herbivorax sp. ANBcel31]MDQ2086613.1 C39 family peptidase [Herbivorax sp. ANBcel31]